MGRIRFRSNAPVSRFNEEVLIVGIGGRGSNPCRQFFYIFLIQMKSFSNDFVRCRFVNDVRPSFQKKKAEVFDGTQQRVSNSLCRCCGDFQFRTSYRLFRRISDALEI